MLWRLGFYALNRQYSSIQLHDPDMLLIGLVLKLLDKKVIYDIHDDYETAIMLRLKPFGKVMARFIAKLWWFYEKTAVRFFDGVIVADQVLARKFARKIP